MDCTLDVHHRYEHLRGSQVTDVQKAIIRVLQRHRELSMTALIPMVRNEMVMMRIEEMRQQGILEIDSHCVVRLLQ